MIFLSAFGLQTAGSRSALNQRARTGGWKLAFFSRTVNEGTTCCTINPNPTSPLESNSPVNFVEDWTVLKIPFKMFTPKHWSDPTKGILFKSC